MTLYKEVYCDMFPGIKFKIIEVMGYDEGKQYAIESEAGEKYSYFSEHELRKA